VTSEAGATYSEQVFLDICGQDRAELLEAYAVKPNGLWVLDAPAGLTRGGRDIWEWHPLRNREVPALPFPFTASQLAAFMWAGNGHGILEKFLIYVASKAEADQGLHFCALGEPALAELGPNGGRAREALKAAFELFVQADARFGRRNDADIGAGGAWLAAARDEVSGALGQAKPAPSQREPETAITQLPGVLGPVITSAIKKVGSRKPAPVMVELQRLAESRPPTAPLKGVVRGGVQYLDSNGNPQLLDLKGLRDRIGKHFRNTHEAAERVKARNSA
jgi:hypothetical protein